MWTSCLVGSLVTFVEHLAVVEIKEVEFIIILAGSGGLRYRLKKLWDCSYSFVSLNCALVFLNLRVGSNS